MLDRQQAAAGLLLDQQRCRHSCLKQIGMRASHERQAAIRPGVAALSAMRMRMRMREALMRKRVQENQSVHAELAEAPRKTSTSSVRTVLVD
ncbi:hypothetical protein NU688_05020 [Variovorax sp. ZS18.2.2]|uniref:hypothetical protein n=1 Tax=Variovorax sp. ZS18.2.2 TaxID=2971255 RepID=UPI00215174B7|nr:hypothetical protein [Variovorax sp. ZS18.2.2]MCR6475509.1 hypothetical protein [Variovorax sp. ZS18.2.2]